MMSRQHKRQEELAYLTDIVMQVRHDHPTIGVRDIYYMSQPEGIGRDRFEAYCRQKGLMSDRKVRKCHTTDSSGVIRFENLAKDFIVERPNQLWQSDITYFELNDRFAYITFITDRYSSRIIGHSVAVRLFTEDTVLPALKSALKTRSGQDLSDLIFHSDGGGQYYSKAFVKETVKHGFKNSMCTYPWENGLAERINGIIKNNYLIHWNIQSFDELTKAVDRAVSLYNEEKPHIRLKRLSPIEYEKNVYLQTSKPVCQGALVPTSAMK